MQCSMSCTLHSSSSWSTLHYAEECSGLYTVHYKMHLLRSMWCHLSCNSMRPPSTSLHMIMIMSVTRGDGMYTSMMNTASTVAWLSINKYSNTLPYSNPWMYACTLSHDVRKDDVLQVSTHKYSHPVMDLSKRVNFRVSGSDLGQLHQPSGVHKQLETAVLKLSKPLQSFLSCDDESSKHLFWHLFETTSFHLLHHFHYVV